jgi:hypothetical protein
VRTILRGVIGAGIAALALAGCGGGGSSSSPLPPAPAPAPAPAPTPSLTPFALISSTPGDGTMSVPRDVLFTALFSTSPAPSTIAAGRVQLIGPQDNVIPTAVSVSGTTLELRPVHGRLPGAATFTVKLSPSITDTNGQGLIAPYTRTFTTARQTWNMSATDLAPLADFTGGTTPSIAADGSGNVVAAWVTRVVDRNVLFSRRSDANGIWGPLFTIRESAPVFGSIHQVSVSFGPGGDAYVGWTEYDSGSKVYVSRQTAGSIGWSTPEEVPGGLSGSVASLLVDASGNVTVVMSTLVQLVATRKGVATGTWSIPHVIASSDYIVNARAIVDRNGNVTVTWMQTSMSGTSLGSARYNINTDAWVPIPPISSSLPHGSAQYGNLAIDPVGTITMVWDRAGDLIDAPTIEASRFVPTQGFWGPVVRLDSTTSVLGAITPGVAVDAAGFSTAVWKQDDRLFYARLAPNSGTWSAPQAIPESEGSRGDEQVAIVADDAGKVTLVVTLSSIVIAFHYDLITAQWSAPLVIGNPASGTTVSANAPVLALDRTGTLSAAWFAWVSVSGMPPLYFITSNRWN